MNKQRAAFFFGSGISRLSKVPTVSDLTTNVLEGAWQPHTDRSFYPCDPNDGSESLGVAKQAQDFLRIVKENIDLHLFAREARISNYEDLYAAAVQIVQDETAEITNPLIAKSVEAIKSASAHLYVRGEHHIDQNRFASLAERAADLIQWVVYYGLSKASQPIGLALISDVAKATSELDIFSLNHDRLIEIQLNQDTVAFADGFSEKSGDVRMFNWSWKDHSVRLFKLHGSTNWYLFRLAEWDRFAAVDSDPDHCRDENGILLDLLNSTPMFLTGTTVKEQAYGTGLVGELFTEFRARLKNHRTLICSGYGWSDKGINIRLNQWLRDARENRIVILHNGSPDELSQKRFWYSRWEDYVKARKVVTIRKWLTECTLADLEPYFDS